MSAGYPNSYYNYNPQPASTIAPTSVYGEQRPTFAEDGTGTPYNSLLNLVGTGLNAEVSYDTSSKDPHMIRARVFIGNIARAIITRDDIIDLFKPFGKLIAVNYFAQQGFGFVQFNEAKDADQSCLTLNMKSWKGCTLDVHLAMLGAAKKPPSHQNAPPTMAAPVMAAPAPEIAAPAAQSLKRGFEDEEYEIFKQNKNNKKFANGDKTMNDDLVANEMCDTMICGNCRFVTSDLEEFKEHRIAGCDRYRDADEPKHRLKCSTCSQRFLGAWGLLQHLTEFHRMLLFNEEPLTQAELQQHRHMQQSSQNSEASMSAINSVQSTPKRNEIVHGAQAAYNNGTDSPATTE